MAAPPTGTSCSWPPPGCTVPQVGVLGSAVSCGQQQQQQQGRLCVCVLWRSAALVMLQLLCNAAHFWEGRPARHCLLSLRASNSSTLRHPLHPLPAGQDVYQQEAYGWFSQLGGRWGASVYVSWDDVTAPAVMTLLTCVLCDVALRCAALRCAGAVLCWCWCCAVLCWCCHEPVLLAWAAANAGSSCKFRQPVHRLPCQAAL